MRHVLYRHTCALNLHFVHLGQPVLEVRPARLLSVVGETVRLHCLVSGEPPPERTWLYKGQKEVPEIFN